MSTNAANIVQASRRLRRAVEDTAAALAAARLDGLLSAEAALETALVSLPRVAAASPEDQHAIRQELVEARIALLRCRRLGAALNDFVRVSFEARGGAVGYEPERNAAGALAGRGFSAKA